MFRGETLDALNREFGVNPGKLGDGRRARPAALGPPARDHGVRTALGAAGVGDLTASTAYA
jgi:hypothetical protein